MKNIVSILKVLVLILAATLGGCAAGYAVGSDQGSPATTRWQQIPDPPEKPVKIADIGGYGRDAQSLFVDTSSGKQYECCGFWPKVWKEAASKRTHDGDSCPVSQGTPLDQAPGDIIDCAYVVQWEWATEEQYVVLLEDGSLWRWRFYTGLDVLLGSMMWGALAGFVIAIGIIFYVRQKQRL